VVDEKIIDRKLDHLKIPIEFDVQTSENYFKYIKLVHHSLPEYDINEIDISVNFFNKVIDAPICIAGMTGGHPISKKINKILANAAEKENIVLGVGSQRAALEKPANIDSFKIINEIAPNVPKIGNIGIGQISDKDFQENDFQKCIDMINADAIAIHFNALHEMLQPNGNTSYKLFEKNFTKIRAQFDIPIIAKETGTGFNKEIAIKLDSLGFDGFDVGGYGGTNFSAIESIRNNYPKKFTRKPADIFKNWGIPTPVSILYVRNISKKLIIATGGIRSGIDIVKSIILGADFGGLAYNFLVSAWKDLEENSILNTINEIKTLKNEIRSCLWLLNVKNIEELKGNHKKIIILGNLYRWLEQPKY